MLVAVMLGVVACSFNSQRYVIGIAAARCIRMLSRLPVTWGCCCQGCLHMVTVTWHYSLPLLKSSFGTYTSYQKSCQLQQPLHRGLMNRDLLCRQSTAASCPHRHYMRQSSWLLCYLPMLSVNISAARSMPHFARITSHNILARY